MKIRQLLEESASRLEVTYKNFTQLPDNLPDQLKYLDISDNESLLSLKGCPSIIESSFFCWNNPKLTSLKYLPKKMNKFSFQNCPCYEELWRLCEVDVIDIVIKRNGVFNRELVNLCMKYKGIGRGKQMLNFQNILIDMDLDSD